ncbi:unnamed protein product [Dibothriocephalus latus]|uniref:Uncharacterized protein n=1 Tax=Dibothriocephalus latus TaxID=60516 RepID=A0A3P6V9F5_DIBLA|nr:unnamed protein product [Dibothriocephalus latus]
MQLRGRRRSAIVASSSTGSSSLTLSAFRISGLERDSKAQLIRRNMEYYETAEYRYTGPHVDSSSSTFTTLVRENVRAGKITAKTLVEDADTQSTA